MSSIGQAIPVGARAAQDRTPLIAMVGNPNAGKSTLFNQLTGLKQKTANYPGVTVERRGGQAQLVPGRPVELIDLPGIYTLNANALDELIAVDVLLGRMTGVGRPDLVVAVLDATKLYQGLFLLSQVLELERPVVVVLTKMDIARKRGLEIDLEQLKQLLQVPIVPVVARSREQLPALKQALDAGLGQAQRVLRQPLWPELRDIAEKFQADADLSLSVAEIERALAHPGGVAEKRLLDQGDFSQALQQARQQLTQGAPAPALEARKRYAAVRRLLEAVERHDGPPASPWSAAAERVLHHPVVAALLFFGLLGLVFQAVFAWATPLMDWIDTGIAAVGSSVAANLPEGALNSLLVDGVIAGVGSVVIFLPQILILFLFIIVLEDIGFLARAAFLMDRLMRAVGLSGQSVIPMISSFACAVPGIMATRVIPNRRDRLATILAAPFMTCSARLPVYTLLIAAFVPATAVGFFNLQGLVLLGLYLLGIFGGVMTALLVRRTALRGPKPPFVLELPPFMWPSIRSVALKLLERAKVFLRRAGTIIFIVAVLVWALAYFPRSESVQQRYADQRAQAQASLSDDALDQRLAAIEHAEAAALLESSFLGHAGKAIEPLFRPLGWDWRVSASVVASFPAREVVIAVMGTIYAVGAEAEQAELADRLQLARRADGSPIFTLPMVIGLLIFYAFCLQCVATVAIMRRETNSWRWPIFAWSYMTGLGYVGALAAYQLGTAWS